MDTRRRRCFGGPAVGTRVAPLSAPSGTPRRPRRTRTAPGTLVALGMLAGIAQPVAGVTLQVGDAITGEGSLPEPGQRVILVTGSTSGLGREVARRLAAGGAHVIVHGRNRERGEALVAEIEEEGTGSARFYAADFASFAEVRALAAAIRRDYERLDVLVNNAGIWLEPEDGRRVSADGHELHFQVNYLSHYLLTRLLLPLLTSSAPARIVNVSSAAQRPIDFDDVMLETGYSDGRGYAQSKLAQVMFTFDLAEELEGTGVTVNALHPATMMDTHMVLSRGARTRDSVEEGAEAVLHLVDAPDVGTGRYFNRMEPARANPQAYDAEARARLRRVSAELTGVGG